MILTGLPRPELASDERALLREYPLGGFLLYQHNCCDALQMTSLCRALWETALDQPPFIAIDHEGGRVHRLPEPFTRFPPAAILGKAADPELAYQAGHACAIELSLAGINVNFAPVLDVHSNPENPVIGDRAFGASAQSVIRIAGAWTRGLRAGGIIPCGKHFPGHGDTDRDSHETLPVVDRPAEALREREVAPFAQACRDGIESLMTAHVLFRRLDATFPATLSTEILTRILRQELGYDGVVFSDDMEMKAVAANYARDEAAVLAVAAGIDVLIYGHHPAAAAAAFDTLLSEAEKSPSLRARIEASYRRIGRLKATRLKRFTAHPGRDLAGYLTRLGHKRLVAAIYGSL